MVVLKQADLDRNLNEYIESGTDKTFNIENYYENGLDISNKEVRSLMFDAGSYDSVSMKNTGHDEFSVVDSKFDNASLNTIASVKMDFVNSDFSESRFDSLISYQMKALNVSIDESLIQNSKLANSEWVDVQLKGVEIYNVNLNNATFNGVEFENVDFRNVDLTKIDYMEQSSFTNCTFVGCTIDRDWYEDAKSRGCQFDEESQEYIEEKIERLENSNSQSLDVNTMSDDDIKKRDRFFRLINQIEINQEGPLSMQDSDLLKATYDKDKDYHIVFGLDDGQDQFYDVVYRGGEPVEMKPNNDELLEHLQNNHSFPENPIPDPETAFVLSVSNNVTKQIEEYHAIRQSMHKNHVSTIRDLESSFNDAISLNSPVDRYKALHELKQETDKSLVQYARADHLIKEVHPEMMKVMDEKNYRVENERQMKRLHEQFKNPHLVEDGPFKDFATLHEVTGKVANLELENIRKNWLVGELYDSPEQSLIMSRFDVNKPFKETISSQAYEYKGASQLLETLTREQISDPKEIVKHYLMIQDTFEQVADKHHSKIDLVKLSDYSKQAFENIVNVVENSFEKEHPMYSRLNLTIQNEIHNGDNFEGDWIIKEAGQLSEPFKVIYSMDENKPMTVLNFAEAQAFTSSQKEYWNHHAKEMIQEHVGVEIPNKNENGIEKPDFTAVKKSLQSQIDAEIQNKPYKKPELEMQMKSFVENQEPEKKNDREMVEIER